jgi:hypothetical protein
MDSWTLRLYGQMVLSANPKISLAPELQLNKTPESWANESY